MIRTHRRLALAVMTSKIETHTIFGQVACNIRLHGCMPMLIINTCRDTAYVNVQIVSCMCNLHNGHERAVPVGWSPAASGASASAAVVPVPMRSWGLRGDGDFAAAIFAARAAASAVGDAADVTLADVLLVAVVWAG